MNTPSPSGPAATALPWWRVKALWLVIGGPAIVVAAGVATTVLAVRGSDPVVQAPPAARARSTAELAQAPALQARNHAAAAAAAATR